MTTKAISSQAAKTQNSPVPPVRVILAEDDNDLRLGIADYLRLRAIDVTDVASGLGFYKALSEDEFDIAILDVNLPDLSGFDLARCVSSKRSMGVIMLTGRAGRDDRIKGYEEGADLYLTKPVDSEELALAIGNLARRVQIPSQAKRVASAPSEYRGVAPAWRLEPVRRRLTSPQGMSISLSGRESMLLERIALAEGSTLSRAEIDAMFGYVSPDPESRRVDAALRRLRLKAKEAGTELPLQIVHAIGVRFAGILNVVENY